MSTIVLTFGDPNPDTVESIRRDLIAYGGSGIIVGELSGTGTYDGQTEHSGAIIIVNVNPTGVRTWRATAARIARAHGQEAIGVIVDPSDSSLVFADWDRS